MSFQIRNFSENEINCLDIPTKECFTACQQGQYFNEKKEKVAISGIKNCLEKTKFYSDKYVFQVPPLKKKEKGNIEIRNESTLRAAYRMKILENKENVCALSFANAFKPGGGILYGSCAQEETLCRSSALYYSLIQEKPSQFYVYHNKNADTLGNAASDCMIYTPDCPTWIVDNKKLEKPFLTSYITSAAVNNTSDRSQNVINEIYEKRIGKIIDCAIENGVKNLVLGAYGCGEFCNDPYEIALLFENCLVGDEKRYYFESISFSILGSNTDNIDAFSDAFDLPITP
ncbi:hypothetical protein M9Y10_042700 [Tritrichomonas musculus]|uniref:Microbial-type PARG catalytic domain-containing protein n=1 Tax=Tritrichomonas musculus TaxID=1915356 RepID=A0ABR2JXX9_9EUKA